MASMVVEYDTEVGAFYVRLNERPFARTVEVSDLVMVDVDSDGEMIGLELLCLPAAMTSEERAALTTRFPLAIDALSEVERLTRLSA